MKAAPVVRLRGVVQHYDWGGCDFIPHLLGLRNPSRQPFAELWMGAHPKAPSLVEIAAAAASTPSAPDESIRISPGTVGLDRLLERSGEQIVGPQHARFAGGLPYLFKILDVARMLSIQAHPTKAQAELGYARENAAGIPLDAPNRNYKDENHKPETGIALTDFWMLHGFRPLAEIADTLEHTPELRPLMPEFAARLQSRDLGEAGKRELLRDLYRGAMTMPQEEVDRLLSRLLTRLRAGPPPDEASPDYWTLQAAADFPLPGGHLDRGIFSIYLLNLVRLRPGQGTFQPAACLHAYLRGVMVELMANSDNVLRGGLTRKHVDTAELLRVLDFESGRPEILDGRQISATERIYRTPAQEFQLSRIVAVEETPHEGCAGQGPEILLMLEGRAELRAGGEALALSRGSIVLAPYGTDYRIESRDGAATIFKASLPDRARI